VASINFRKYLSKFEKEVIYKGVENDSLGKHILVSCRSVPFDSSNFARAMGRLMPIDIPMAIDYYGYVKKSKGFDRLVKDSLSLSNGQQVKLISVPVVHFASLKIELIAELTESVYLVSKFVEFKNIVLEKRGFRGR
jgi:hypothetical protein